jgi:hypothetical protein
MPRPGFLRTPHGAGHIGSPRFARETGGFYIEPTVFDVKPENTLAREEVLGPVLALTRFDEPDDAIRVANGTNCGLVAGLWTKDMTLAHPAAARSAPASSGSTAGTAVTSRCRSAERCTFAELDLVQSGQQICAAFFSWVPDETLRAIAVLDL